MLGKDIAVQVDKYHHAASAAIGGLVDISAHQTRCDLDLERAAGIPLAARDRAG